MMRITAKNIALCFCNCNYITFLGLESVPIFRWQDSAYYMPTDMPTNMPTKPLQNVAKPYETLAKTLRKVAETFAKSLQIWKNPCQNARVSGNLNISRKSRFQVGIIRVG